MRCKLWLILGLGLLTLSGCIPIKPENIPDGIVTAIECNLTDPESCGPVGCSQVHTNPPLPPVVDLDAYTCGTILPGQIAVDGIFLSKLINIVSDFCTENTGACSYTDAQMIKNYKIALWRARNPKH